MSIDKLKDAIGIDRPPMPKERQHFALLTLAEPNFFGGIPAGAQLRVDPRDRTHLLGIVQLRMM